MGRAAAPVPPRACLKVLISIEASNIHKSTCTQVDQLYSYYEFNAHLNVHVML